MKRVTVFAFVLVLGLCFSVMAADKYAVGSKVWIATDPDTNGVKGAISIDVVANETVNGKSYVLLGSDPKKKEVGQPFEVSALDKVVIQTVPFPSGSKFAAGDRIWISMDPAPDGTVSFRQLYVVSAGKLDKDDWLFVTVDPTNPSMAAPMLTKEIEKRLAKQWPKGK